MSSCFNVVPIGSIEKLSPIGCCRIWCNAQGNNDGFVLYMYTSEQIGSLGFHTNMITKKKYQSKK